MTRIRKSPTMTGPFAETIHEFIQYKRSAGFKYADEPKCLSQYLRLTAEVYPNLMKKVEKSCAYVIPEV